MYLGCRLGCGLEMGWMEKDYGGFIISRFHGRLFSYGLWL